MRYLKWFLFLTLLILPFRAMAMPVGTLLYRTSSNGQMYGYNTDELVKIKNGLIKSIDCGHTGIYIGQENGVDYVVEALAGGVIKVPAKYFVSQADGEKMIGARIPKQASLKQRERAAFIAKKIAEQNLKYDFDFNKQKGPGSGEWTCVGLTEKVYESANLSSDLPVLEYDSSRYAVNITPDGYDKTSIANSETEDCFSERFEFSKISKKRNVLIPAPEIFGFNAGKEYAGDRYFFLPYTQYLQKSLTDVKTDITLSSPTVAEDIRGKVPLLGLLLKWSLINNPVSSFKNKLRQAIAVYDDVKNGKSDFLESDENYKQQDLSVQSEELEAVTSEKTVQIISSAKAASISNNIPKTVATTQVKEIKATTTKAAIPKVSAEKPIEQKKVEVAITQKPAIYTPTPKAIVAITQPKPYVYENNYQPPVTNSTSSSSNSPTPTASSTPEQRTITLLISRIQAEGSDDWLEIYNYGNEDLDLAALNIRLEKTKTGTDPAILLRFNEEGDISYKSGKIIKAKGYFVVTRDDANQNLRGIADGLALRDDFTWTGNGYTIYLASNAVSSNTDVDIIDKVGFGPEATYFEGSGFAPEITTCNLLERKALASSTVALMASGGVHELLGNGYDSNNNANDFVLMKVCTVETPNENDNENNNNASSSVSISKEISNLLHFDECRGNTTTDSIRTNNLEKQGEWTPGLFGCGLNINSQSNPIIINQPLGSSFSLSWHHWLTDSGRYIVKLTDNSLGSIEFLVYPYYTELKKPDEENNRDSHWFWKKEEWHQVALAVDKNAKKLLIYDNGQKVLETAWEVNGFFLDQISIKGDNGPVILDELSAWSGVLSSDEISGIKNKNLEPATSFNSLDNFMDQYSWSFDTATSSVELDLIKGQALTFNPNLRMHRGYVDMGVNHDMAKQVIIESALPAGLAGPSLGLSFWWRNISYPLEGRGQFLLVSSDDKTVLAIAPSFINTRVDYNHTTYHLGQNITPADKEWHFFRFEYNAKSLKTSLYIDNELKWQAPFAWPIREVSKLRIVAENGPYDFDSLKLYSN